MCKMVRRPSQIWMFWTVVLVATSILTGAAPVPTPEPEATTLSLLTTEMVTVTTSSPIVLHFEGNAHLSSVYTLQPAETTIVPETDLDVTTGGDKIVIAPKISAEASEGPQVNTTRFERVAYGNATQAVNGSSHLTDTDQRESVDKQVQTTTVSSISTTFAETSTQDVNISTDLPVTVSVHGLPLETDHSTTTYRSYDVEVENKFTGTIYTEATLNSTEAKVEYIPTDAPISTIKVEYSTTEEIPTTVLTTERAPYSNTVDEEASTEVPVSSDSVATTAEIFVSTGYSYPGTHSSPSDSQRGSRHFAEEASKPPANDTEIQPEVTSSESISTEPGPTSSVTQSPPITSTDEQPQPVASTAVQTQEPTSTAEVTHSTELIPTQSPTLVIPAETNVTNETSANVTQVSTQPPTNATSPGTSDVPQTPTTQITPGVETTNDSDANIIEVVSSKSDKEFPHSTAGPSTDPHLQPNSSKVVIPDAKPEDTATWLSPETTRVSSPSSASLESSASTVKNQASGGSRIIAVRCTPEPEVSVFQGDLRYFVVLGLTGCSVAATFLLLALLLIRLRAGKRRDTSPSLQLCGCLGRTQRAEITPRRAEVLEVKPRPGCNLASDADCRADEGEGEDVPLALSVRSGAPVPVAHPSASVASGQAHAVATPAPTSTVKSNGGAPPPNPGDSPV